MQEPCRSCPRKAIDFGGCRCQAFALTGDATNTDPVCTLTPLRALIDAALADVEAPPDVSVPRTSRSNPNGHERIGARDRDDRARSRLRQSTRALDALDLVDRPGALVGLLGPNGAGKTTAMLLLATLLRRRAARARVFGHDIVRTARRSAAASDSCSRRPASTGC